VDTDPFKRGDYDGTLFASRDRDDYLLVPAHVDFAATNPLAVRYYARSEPG
jgi:hypothetical protein